MSHLEPIPPSAFRTHFLGWCLECYDSFLAPERLAKCPSCGAPVPFGNWLAPPKPPLPPTWNLKR